jgi:predicted dehydrogenase
MSTVNWGIIGCGNVTELKSGPAFNLVHNSRLVAVMRRNADKAKDYANRHNVPKWYGSAEELINDPHINAVYVATPPSTHAGYAIRVMKAGKPVYVEKPMALNTSECEEMLKVSRETGQLLFVAYYRRALPYFLKIKELIENGTIGNLLYFNLCLQNPAKPEEINQSGNIGWRVDPSISGGGHFHDLASHQIDYLEYLLGPVDSVKSFATNRSGLYKPDDTIVANFRFKSGVTGTGSWCFTVPPILKKDQTEIVGSKGRIIFTFFGKPDLIIESENYSDQLNIPHPPHIQQPLIELVVKNILGKGTSPSTGETGIRTTMIMDRIISAD